MQIRKSVRDFLELLSQPSAQLEYERSLGQAGHAPTELTLVFCHDVFDPKNEAFTSALSSDELKGLSHVYGLLSETAKAEHVDVPTMLNDPTWRRVIAVAQQLSTGMRDAQQQRDGPRAAERREIEWTDRSGGGVIATVRRGQGPSLRRVVELDAAVANDDTGGSGDDVTAFLARTRPVCPVLIHSSKAMRAPAMHMELAMAGYRVRLCPFQGAASWASDVCAELDPN
ncbi:MAG: hypothetical protein U0795_11850 [Pirellulales bacterium]